jgi:hypothetical protein
MAAHRVYLRRESGAEITDLPPVCMRCGARATRSFSKTFVHGILFRRQRVAMPLCDKHWFHLTAFRFLPLVFMAVVFSIVFWLNLFEKWVHPGGEVMHYLWMAYYTFLVLYVIAANVYRYNQIRVLKITDRYLELTNVAWPFVEAVNQEEEYLRRRFTQEDGERFDASPGGDDRILPSDDGYQAKP